MLGGGSTMKQDEKANFLFYSAEPKSVFYVIKYLFLIVVHICKLVKERNYNGERI